MKHKDIEKVLVPLLAERLRALAPTKDLGNGTLLADAAASVLACDMANMGVKMMRLAEEEVEALPESKLHAVISTTAEALANRGVQWRKKLPYGTEITSIGHPGVRVGSHILLARRGTPGLHRPGEATAQTGEGGRRLLAAIVEKMASLASIEGYDAPIPTIDDVIIEQANNVWRSKLLIPVRGGPGILTHEEENIVDPEAMLDGDIPLQAKAVLERAVAAFEDRVATDADTAKLKSRLEPLLAKARKQGIEFELTGITVRNRSTWRRAYPVFKTLGNDLRPTTWISWADTTAGDEMERSVENQMAVQRRLKRRAEATSTAGGHGSIDVVTLAMMRSREIEVEATLSKLMEKRRISIQLGRNGRKRDTMNLSWRGGVVMSSFTLGEGVLWRHGAVVLKRDQLPQTIRTALVGRPLTALIQHEGLPEGLTIRSVTGPGIGWTQVNVTVPVETFQIATVA